MRQQQQCKNCKNHFADDAPQKDYKLYANYGFANEEQFKSHNSKNKHCPCKLNITENAIEEYNSGGNITSMLGTFATTVAVAAVALSNAPIPDVEWGPYIQGIMMSDEDNTDNQEMIKIKLRKHLRGGNPLWFRTSEIAASIILNEILKPETQIISLVAEPGSGKTAVMHCLTFLTTMLPYDRGINPNCITITTGMSDNDWLVQIRDNFKLRDDSTPLWESLNKVEENFCITHRSNFHKRISWLLNNLQYISNHIFIIDENHIADEIGMTISDEFRRLGLTTDKMKEYNIKIINVSATPDVQLSILLRHPNHKVIQLINGENYKGFKYFNDQKMIENYDDHITLDDLIRRQYSTPRYHYIRARTHIEKGEYREGIKSICAKNNWRIIEDDSSNNHYLSFKADENERKAEIEGKSIIRTYLPPSENTLILIKNKYPASKRLKITKYTGLVIEKPAKEMNTTITCNGLIPRFWGYDELPTFPHNQKPLFICNKKSVDEYIKFSEDFVYDGKNYTGNKIKSDKDKLKELGITWLSDLAGIEAIKSDKRIGITNGKNGERDYFKLPSDIAPFLRSKGFTNVQDKDELESGPNGYMFCNRDAKYKLEGKPMIYSEYEEKFVKNGGGTHINRQWPNGSGQPYVIWPVYETINTNPNDVKYYLHYLKLKK